MAEDQGKEEEKFDFTREGEAVGYISLDQARVLAMEHARDNTGFYGRRYARRPLFWEVVSQEETEDYYEITLTYRPAQRFDGQPGTELFIIEKEGPIRLRQIVDGPEEKRNRWPIIASALGVTAVGAVVGALFATGVLPPSSQDAGGDTTTSTRVSVVPDAPAKLISPQQDVTIDLGVGSVPGPAQLSYQRVPPEQIPNLPPGYLAPQRAFDLSLTGDQEADPTPLLLRPITITVALTWRDRDLAALIESNVVIQHFDDDAKQWTPLPTTVDFDSLTAQARVDNLSVFALTIKRAESRAPADPMAPEPDYTLAVSAAPTNGGSINGGGEYADGTQVAVSAIPNLGWAFSGWSGACSGAASCVVTMDSNKAVTASFSQQRFTLTVNARPDRGGDVTGGGTYAAGAEVTVTAEPSLGYGFGGWSGACTGDASCVVTMDSHKTVTASFSQQLFTLTTNVTPARGGRATGGGSYLAGTTVTVTASPAQGYGFGGWSGACLGSGNCLVILDSNKTVTASFSQEQYTLTTQASPSSGGRVTGGGIYASGTPVMVTATPSQGHTFTQWSGVCSGSGACSVNMDSNKTVTANFIRVQSYTLTASASPPAGGTVTGGGVYGAGTQVAVSATPNSGWAFSGWIGACSGSGNCLVNLDTNKTVTASFSQEQRTLTAQASPASGGSVAGGGTYGVGAQVAVSATPNLGWSFSGWSGACSGAGSCAVSMDSDNTVIARFSRQLYTLTTRANPGSGGSVTGGGLYGAGTQLTVIATPISGWVFGGWSGACLGSGLCLVNLDTNKTVTASFSQEQYTLTTQASPSSGGRVTGGGNYVAGTQVTATATPNSGWEFSGWSGACAGTGSCVVNLDSSKTVTANFIQVQSYTLTASAEPPNGGSLTGGGSYAAGTQVTVTATPNSGWVFDFWLEPPTCSGTGACVVTMDSDKTVTADFNQQLFTLTADANPSTGGTVSGGGTYSPATQATVTATPNSGYTFTGWSGACSGTGSCLVTMDSNKKVTANFTQQFTLTAVAEPSTGGTVSPAGISIYDSGSQVTATATAASGYSFDKWTGACTGTGPCIVTLDSNKTVTASFSLFPIPGQVTFDRYTDGSPITIDVILTGTEFQAQGILLAAAPESSYCSDAKVAAVRMVGTYGKADNFLTTALSGAVNSCNTILVEIQFINPARQVTLSFSGATVTYTMKVYDSGGSLLGTVQQGAVFGSGTFQISFSSRSGNISRVTFGKQTAVTAVSQINFQE